jgi:hypothetical protein
MEELDASQESTQVVDNSVSDENTNTDEELNHDSESGDEQAEEEDEIEVDGKKFMLPKSAAEKLKSERLMQADYTRKTQEVAESRRQVEQYHESVRAQAEMQQAYVNEIAEVTAIDKQLAEYAKLDFQALILQDPVQAMQLQHQHQVLLNARATAANNITQKQQQQNWEAQQETAKSLQEGQAVLARDIKGWSPELAQKLVNYGAEIGFKKERLSSITDPSVVKLLHKAYLFDQLSKKPAASKVETQEKPVTRIAAKSSGAQKDPDKMSSDEWLRWRESQIKRR